MQRERESVGRDEKEGERVLFLVETRQNLLNFSCYCFCECGCRFPGETCACVHVRCCCCCKQPGNEIVSQKKEEKKGTSVTVCKHPYTL